MVYARCNNCLRNISIPSNSTRATRHVCQVCKVGFCSSCGTPFICRKCFSHLDVNDQQAIRQQSEKYRSKAGGGIAMTAIGAVLLMVAVYSSYYRWLIIMMTIYGSPSFTIAPLFEVVIGLGLLIGGLATIASSKAELLRLIQQASTRVGSVYSTSGNFVRSSSWATSSPMIPQSAYIPAPQELPPQRATIPESAYVPLPQPSLVIPRSTPSSEGTSESVKFCGQCGERLPDVGGLRFCPSCGAPTN